MSEIQEATTEHFANSLFPLYHGPFVRIRLDPGDNEYQVSKPLLCENSKYFSAMFGDKFKEGQEEVAVMEQIDGVLSPRSFKGLLQWLYHGVVNFEPDKPENQIYAAIELVRLGDMCMISQLEAEATRQFQTILMQTRLSKPCELSDGREIRINNYCLERRTIISATFLPQGHEVRRVVAAASVHGYLRDDNHESLQLTQNYPIFGADVLQEVRKCLQTLKYEKYEKYEKSKTHTVRDPLSEYYCTMEI